MKKLLPLFLILTACSSNTHKMRSVSSSEEEMSWVDDLDFSVKKEEKYVADSDEFKISKSDESENTLIKETVAVLSPAKIDAAIKKTDDPLMKINMNCYQNKFDEAFKIADEMYATYKANTSYWNQIGTCYYLNGDYAKAILFYNKSRDLDKKFVPPINNLGVVYQKQGKFQKALAAFKLASDTNKFAITPTYNLAQMYLKFGTVGKAYPIFAGLYKRSPKDMELAGALGTSLLIRGDYQEASDVFAKMSKDSLQSPEVGLNYALTLKFLNRQDEAKDVLSSLATPLGDLAVYAKKVESFVRN